ncbi:MAG: hypothetical protein ACI4M6_05640 [Christensenellaceae bacterium]
MKSCENCFYYDTCQEKGEMCEYYDPLYGAEKIAIEEYEKDLAERAEEYQKVVDEQQS